MDGWFRDHREREDGGQQITLTTSMSYLPCHPPLFEDYDVRRETYRQPFPAALMDAVHARTHGPTHAARKQAYFLCDFLCWWALLPRSCGVFFFFQDKTCTRTRTRTLGIYFPKPTCRFFFDYIFKNCCGIDRTEALLRVVREMPAEVGSRELGREGKSDTTCLVLGKVRQFLVEY